MWTAPRVVGFLLVAALAYQMQPEPPDTSEVEQRARNWLALRSHIE